MRTTVTLADDVAAAVEEMQRARHVGVSEAVNELIRAGLLHPPRGGRFEQVTHDLGSGIDYTNVGDAIETLEGPRAR